MSLRDLALTPRAPAALVSLRKGPRTTGSIADAIGDATVVETRHLLRLLATGTHDNARGHRLVVDLPYRPNLWGLTHDGLGWLQAHGLDVSDAVKAALFAATDAELAVSNALLDAFAAEAPRTANTQFHGNTAADALLQWSILRGHSARTENRTLHDGRTWKVVSVDLPGDRWIAAHRDFDTISAPGTEVLL